MCNDSPAEIRSPASPDALFAALYRVHALSGDLLGIIERGGKNKHVVTAAIVNLVDAWLGAVDAVEVSIAEALLAYEVRAVRLAMFNASATMIQKLNRALWARAGNATYDPNGHLHRRSTWQRRRAERKELVIDFVIRNPGLNLHEIGERLQMARYTVQAPLLALQAEGRIRVERQGKRLRRFFACEAKSQTLRDLVGESVSPCR